MTDNLAGALASFYTKCSTIHKDAQAQYGKFADLAGVLSVVNPALASCGLAVTQSFDDDETGRYLVTTLHHISGEKMWSKAKLVTEGGRGNPLHTWGGAVTYQRRYALLSMLNLAAGIEDDDADTFTDEAPKPKKEAKAAPKAAPKAADLGPDAPADKEEIREVLSVVSHFAKSNKHAFDEFCTQFRTEFDIPADAKVSQHIQSRKHTSWAQNFIASLPLA